MSNTKIASVFEAKESLRKAIFNGEIPIKLKEGKIIAAAEEEWEVNLSEVADGYPNQVTDGVAHIFKGQYCAVQVGAAEPIPFGVGKTEDEARAAASEWAENVEGLAVIKPTLEQWLKWHAEGYAVWPPQKTRLCTCGSGAEWSTCGGFDDHGSSYCG
jgi:hypothetical protein